jgi:RNA polymerase sigma factor (TIGR02999 family)
MDSRTHHFTGLLHAWSDGNVKALDELTPLVYAELRRIAGRYFQRERPGHILQSTALVHEAFLQLVDTAHVRWQDRAHFFALASQMMRRLLVAHARSHNASKRGGRAIHLDVHAIEEALPAKGGDLAALGDALDELERLNPRQAKVIELRFFGGLSVEEAAEVLKLSPQSVLRDWRLARAWLHSQLSGD